MQRPWGRLRGWELTSTLVMSQSLTAWLWAPLVTIWKPLAVAVCSSTESRRGGVTWAYGQDHSWGGKPRKAPQMQGPGPPDAL